MSGIAGFCLALVLFFGPIIALFVAILLPSTRPFVIGAGVLCFAALFIGVGINTYEAEQAFPKTAYVKDKDMNHYRRGSVYKLYVCHENVCKWKEVTHGKYERAEIGNIFTYETSDMLDRPR